MRTSLCLLICFASCLNTSAQSNAPASFQGYTVGAVVRVRCEKPLVLLSRATLKEINATNIVLLGKDERFVLAKSVTDLSDPIGPTPPARPITTAKLTAAESAAKRAAPLWSCAGRLSPPRTLGLRLRLQSGSGRRAANLHAAEWERKAAAPRPHCCMKMFQPSFSHAGRR